MLNLCSVPYVMLGMFAGFYFEHSFGRLKKKLGDRRRELEEWEEHQCKQRLRVNQV